MRAHAPGILAIFTPTSTHTAIETEDDPKSAGARDRHIRPRMEGGRRGKFCAK
ncbi:hypothetical protein BJV78DRAFT_1166945 [Lactifluus subvellereus]|nr:hypothetical protein BJV78DRAFT_1166945 [Lactifluus subvellereus]